MSTDTDSAMSALDIAQKTIEKAPIITSKLTQPWSQELVKFLAVCVLGFSCLALITAAVLLWRDKAKSQQVLRVIGVISIIGFSALLLVVGYDNDQLTPIIGLFGAISGYLIGKDSKTEIN